MAREVLLRVLLGMMVGLGCSLLDPYPRGGDPANALASSRPGGDSPFDPDDGDEQDPLIDPAIDDSISVTSNNDPTIAFPGEAFLIDLNFTAERDNVVGGGIQFPGSDEIQWTFIDEVQDMPGGMIRFGYAVENKICDDLPNLCHEVKTKQFAVAENLDGDVDGDGEDDGQFVVSPPANVTVVLQCATCESESCIELLPEGACAFCQQPAVCSELFDLCYAPGRPKEGSDEAEAFDTFLDEKGLSWTTAAGCTAGERACENTLESSMDECLMVGGSSGGSGSSGSGT